MLLMSKFICTNCEKSLSNKFSLERHNEKCNVFYCHHCDEIFNSEHKFKNHVRENLIEVINYYRKNFICQMNENKQLNDRIKEVNKKNKELKKELNYKDDFIKDYKKIANSSSKVLDFLIKNYPSAPRIKSLKDSYTKDKDDKMSISDYGNMMVTKYTKNQFSMYIGDKIIDRYKKEDPEEQSMWSSDISRITYYKKLDEWEIDKHGTYIMENIITPMINREKTKIRKI